MPDLGRDDSSSSSESGSDDDRPLEFAHAYNFGENVEYFSKSHNKWVSARVTGNNYFNKSPLDIDRRFEAKFVCTIGRGVQERRDVPMALLRTIPSEAQPVSVFSGHGLKGKWFPASVHGLTTASQTTIGYTIKYDEGDLDGNESKVVAGVPAKHLRSRFPEFARVQVYRGPCLGWEDAVVVRQKQDEDGPARQPHEEEPTDSELESDSDGSARHERTETEPMPTGADRGSMTAGNPPAGASSDSDSDSDSDDAEAAEGAEDSDDAEGAEGGEGAEAAEGAAAGPEAPSTPISSAVADSPRDHTAPGGSRETALSPPRSPRGVVVRTEKRKQSQGGEIWKSKNADLHDIDRFMDPDMPRHRLVDSKALENSRHNRNKANNNKGPKNNKSSNSPHAHWVQVTICPYRPPPSAEGSGKHGSRKTQDKGGGVGGFSDDESASKMSSPRGGALPVGAAPALDQPVLNPEEEEDVPSYLLRFDEEYLRRLRLERDMREAELDDDGNENDPTRVLGIIRNMPSREVTGVSGSTRTPRSMLGPYPSPRSVASMASTRRSHISGTPSSRLPRLARQALDPARHVAPGAGGAAAGPELCRVSQPPSCVQALPGPCAGSPRPLAPWAKARCTVLARAELGLRVPSGLPGAQGRALPRAARALSDRAALAALGAGQRLGKCELRELLRGELILTAAFEFDSNLLHLLANAKMGMLYCTASLECGSWYLGQAQVDAAQFFKGASEVRGCARARQLPARIAAKTGAASVEVQRGWPMGGSMSEPATLADLGDQRGGHGYGGGGGYPSGKSQNYAHQNKQYHNPGPSRSDAYLRDALGNAREMQAASMAKEARRAAMAEKRSLADAARRGATEVVGNLFGISKSKIKKSIDKKKHGKKDSVSGNAINLKQMKQMHQQFMQKKKKDKQNKKTNDDENEDNAAALKKMMAQLQKSEAAGADDLSSLEKDEQIEKLTKAVAELQKKTARSATSDGGACAGGPAREGRKRLPVPPAFDDAETPRDDAGITDGIRTLTQQLLPDWGKLASVPKLTQTILNQRLESSGLSKTTGVNKRQKIDQLVNKIESTA
ncbi:unnamed protein product [Prorocentrum cordatum]|uniref:Uncharacterized protein n=1 Tax=Prorocentrum cordatum TaxID=2364126 RepID=A0ABN9VUN2_9DINO|nr:unnamed protein product [Polarella glacialis]